MSGPSGHSNSPAAAASSLAAAADARCDGEATDSGLILRRKVRIRNARGLHARAAAKLVAMAERFCACITVARNGEKVNGEKVPACSIMGLLMLGAGQGTELTIEAEGWDAKEALEAICALIEAGFHEE